MVMHNPPHPGEVVREFCIEPLGLSVTKAAKGLGVSRSSLSENKAQRNPCQVRDIVLLDHFTALQLACNTS